VNPGSGDQAPGRHLALSVLPLRSPTLRVRYRHGVLIGPYGYPDWLLCARVVLELPAPDPRLTVDEVRVLDVLAANLAMARAAGTADGDPLWPAPPTGDIVATPPGWCWAHAGPTGSESARRLALVPVELHGAFRHAGGVRLLPDTGRGLRFTAPPSAVGPAPGEPVPPDLVDKADQWTGWPLPPAYRRFLAATNGAGPVAPAVSPRFGFVADQPLFGLGRSDPLQDLVFAPPGLRDRFTLDLLPIGYVQGGLLAVKVAGGDVDSIWYWDDDDPRDREGFDAHDICANLLHRCADSIDDLWSELVTPPDWLMQHARYWVDHGLLRPVRDPALGVGLPPSYRAPGSVDRPAQPDPLVRLLEAV
jgi:hypothetical protein